MACMTHYCTCGVTILDNNPSAICPECGQPMASMWDEEPFDDHLHVDEDNPDFGQEEPED